MVKRLSISLLVFALGLTGVQAAALDVSLVKEAKASLERGAEFLLSEQEENGSWMDEPAITALAVTALHQSGVKEHADDIRKAVNGGRGYILDYVRKDGSIAGTKSKYVNYTTAICLTALATVNHPDDRDIMREARRFLIAMQLDEDHPEHPTSPDNPFYGGIGYGSAGPTRPDLSNTQWALEALHMTEHLDKDTPYSKESELAWKRAMQFVKEVQNVPEDAGPTWVVSKADNPNMDGGGIYKPNESKVNGKIADPESDARGGLRAYGSMTYAGLKSMIYADLDKDDYRVQAAVDWARRHYTLDENPVIGAEGHYYYLQTFAKAMDAFGKDKLTTADGETRSWRADLVRKVLELQRPGGHWLNKRSGRWMESIPPLVTSYAMIAMEVALNDE